MIHTLTIPGWQPAPLNKLLRNRWQAHRLKRHDRDMIAHYARAHVIPPALVRRRVTLIITLGKGQRAPDPDSFWKSTLDALVHARLLLDDDRFNVELMPVVFNRRPRIATTIVLEDVE